MGCSIVIEFLTSETSAIGALLIVLFMFGGFLSERWPAEVIAISGAAIPAVIRRHHLHCVG